jgi:hypothetical protein
MTTEERVKMGSGEDLKVTVFAKVHHSYGDEMPQLTSSCHAGIRWQKWSPLRYKPALAPVTMAIFPSSLFLL